MMRLAKVVETIPAQNRALATAEPIPFREDAPGSAGEEGSLLCLYDEVKYQSILGFGGAFTEATAVNFHALTPAQREQLLSAYFDPQQGIGYNFCRLTIHSCDFSPESYSYDDVDGDFDLEHFTIEHDRKEILPLVREVRRRVPGMLLLASPWSPPAWMKTNRRMDKGGALREECRDVWARYVARYLQEYEREGVPIWGVTIQNEAKAAQGWESCTYSADQERDFLLGYLRPALERAGLGDRKVFFWDHNKERVVERALRTLCNARARAAADGVAVHWYSGDHFTALDVFHELFPEQMILSTEHCVGKTPEVPWASGERYAHDIMGDLNHWANAWVDWNMLLHEDGGPDHWLQEQRDTGWSAEKTWIGESPIQLNRGSGQLEFASSYAYIGHFSKFLRRGARRIGYSLFTDALEACAFCNPDGQIVVVLLNTRGEDQTLRLRHHGCLADYVSRAHSITTFLLEDDGTGRP
jgi:glucosylceramidase